MDKGVKLTRNSAREKKLDKRARRTRERLQTTLHELLQKQDYDSITVDEICVHGAVGRSTFYTHFKSKDDLKRSTLEHLHAELLSAQSCTIRGDQPFAFSRALFEHARKHVGDYQSLSRGRGVQVALKRIKQIVTHLVRGELSRVDRTRNAHPDVTIDLETTYVVGALMSLVVWWLNEGARTDVEVIDGLFTQMTRSALQRRTASE
jgi:AcrR family transcriptional regulator